jgi:hypothetical protein
MIYTLLILLIALLLCLLGYLRYRYGKLLAYTKKSDTERIALAQELYELKEQSDYITFKLHGN